MIAQPRWAAPIAQTMPPFQGCIIPAFTFMLDASYYSPAGALRKTIKTVYTICFILPNLKIIETSQIVPLDHFVTQKMLLPFVNYPPLPQQ